MGAVGTVTDVAAYIDTLANLMGLTGWTITVRPATASEDAEAEIEVVYGRKRAIIHLSDGWDKMSGEDQREALVHELIHAAIAPLSQLANELADGEAAEVALAQCEEWVVDQMATAWARELPLP